MNEYLLLLIFLVIASLYASIGFGGGSSYLAILSLVLLSFYEIRSLALILNIVVVSIGTITYIRQRIFSWKLFWPFLVLSIPMAFVGARFKLSQTTFFIVLGATLIMAASMLIFQSFNHKVKSRSLKRSYGTGIGGGIGFLSGLVGIGGGIFLSPFLNLLGWESSKRIAALASFFILVNSIAGITGLLIGGTFEFNPGFALKLIASVAVGGFIGSQFSIKLDVKWIRLLTAMLVLYVGLRLVLQHGFSIII